MSKRYGRNQRRRHLAQIAELEVIAAQQNAAASQAKADAWAARAALSEARAAALKEFVENAGYIEAATQRIAAELGRALPSELLEPARTLLAAQRKRPNPLRPDFDARMDAQHHFAVLRGTIPSIAYNIQIETW